MLKGSTNKIPMTKIETFICIILVLFLLTCSYWLGSVYGRPPLRVFRTSLINRVISESSKIDGNEVLLLINKERDKKGLQMLKMDDDLKTVAYLRAKNILDSQYFSHEATGSGEYAYEKISKDMGLLWRYRKIGENLAKLTGNERDLVNAWLLSKSHRGLVLGDYDDVGIYSVDGKFRGLETTVSVLIVGKKN